MMHIVSQRKLIFIYLLLKTRLDAFVAETRSDATCGRVYLRSSTAFRCSKCFILAAPKRASAVAFKTQFERSRNAFGTMKKPTWAARIHWIIVHHSLIGRFSNPGWSDDVDGFNLRSRAQPDVLIISLWVPSSIRPNPITSLNEPFRGQSLLPSHYKYCTVHYLHSYLTMILE
jgi:hypothetical protein